MKINRTVVLIGLVLFSLVGGCGGGGGGGGSTTAPPPPNPLFVRVSGNDNNSGADANNALASISRAAQLARSNYTIYVGAGTYRAEVNTARAGAAAPNALTFIADVTGAQTRDAGDVIIDVTGVRGAAGFNLANAMGSLIDGFIIKGAADAGIVIKSNSDDFTIQHCEIHDGAGDGIRVQSSSNVLVFNNLIYDNSGTGIAIVQGSPDAHLINNTVVRNAVRGITIGNTDSASPQPFVRNNIMQNNGGDNGNFKIFTPPPPSVPRSDVNYQGDFNLVFPDNTYVPNAIRRPHDVNLDAQFVGQTNFHLQPDSPAIDAGDSLNNMPNLRNQLLQRSTVGGGNLDTRAIDIGYHFRP